jgi:hypothetical protein
MVGFQFNAGRMHTAAHRSGVTETAKNLAGTTIPGQSGYGLSYSPPGSFLESTGGSVLARAEGFRVWPKTLCDFAF